MVQQTRKFDACRLNLIRCVRRHSFVCAGPCVSRVFLNFLFHNRVGGGGILSNRCVGRFRQAAIHTGVVRSSCIRCCVLCAFPNMFDSKNVVVAYRLFPQRRCLKINLRRKKCRKYVSGRFGLSAVHIDLRQRRHRVYNKNDGWCGF